MGSPVSAEHAIPDGIIHGWLALCAGRTPGAQFMPNATVILDAENTVQPDALLRRPPEHGGTSITIVSSGKEYANCLKDLALRGVEGGRAEDALILAAAEKSRAERIYTFNASHFQALAGPGLQDLVVSP